MLRQHNIQVFEAKRILDESAKFLPMNAQKPWNDDDILEFVKRKEWMLITADKGLAKKYEYGILVSANCQKPAETQLEQAIDQYEMIKKNGRLRRVHGDSGFPTKSSKPVFIEAFNETFHIPTFEI